VASLKKEASVMRSLEKNAERFIEKERERVEAGVEPNQQRM
jgi:hypothetical protein